MRCACAAEFRNRLTSPEPGTSSAWANREGGSSTNGVLRQEQAFSSSCGPMTASNDPHTGAPTTTRGTRPGRIGQGGRPYVVRIRCRQHKDRWARVSRGESRLAYASLRSAEARPAGDGAGRLRPHLEALERDLFPAALAEAVGASSATSPRSVPRPTRNNSRLTVGASLSGHPGTGALPLRVAGAGSGLHLSARVLVEGPTARAAEQDHLASSSLPRRVREGGSSSSVTRAVAMGTGFGCEQ